MHKNRPWNRDNRDRNMRGGFRGGRGGNRGWSGNHRGFKPHWGSFEGPGVGNKFQNNYSGKKGYWKKKDIPGKRLSEEDIGVTEYVSTHAGFNGVIKSRYSDFQVSEISEQGEIAKLTCTNAPPAPEEDAVSEDEDLLLSKYNLEILPMETWDKINTLAMSKEPDPGCVEIDMEGVTKEQRTKIHDAVKKAFGDSIVGSTVNIDDKKLMRFQKFKKGVRIDNRVKWTWPAEYVHFIVHKENCDTMDAAVRIAERIGVHVKPSMLGYAGTKDRRAKTSQWFSARRLDPRRFVAATRYLKDIHVGNFCFKHTNLKLGMLNGNRFRIALRNVTAPDELVDTACRHLQENGFINYYGLQRFGSRVDTPTYNIGLKLLQSKFKEAIDLILQCREGALEPALRAYRDSGAAAAVKLLPRRTASHNEPRLIRALADAPNDLLGALGKLARNTRLLYLHSYQSLLWNRAVSERLRRSGLKPAVGDLVPLVQVDKEDEFEDEDSDSEENQSDSETKEEKQEVEKKKEVKVETVKEKQQQKNEEKPKIPVKVLTQEDIDSGKYSILDIVMPLPGYSVEYPPNMKAFYEEELTKNGLTLDLRHKIKGYSMSGAYRRVLARPRDVTWRCVRYADPFADLIASDLDDMHNTKLSGIVEDGKYKALLLNMTLPASCYATMALRELLKVDTSSDIQAALNNYHQERKTSTAEENGEKNTSSESKEKIEKVDSESGEKSGKAGRESGEKSAKTDSESGMKSEKADSESGEKCGEADNESKEKSGKANSESGEKSGEADSERGKKSGQAHSESKGKSEGKNGGEKRKMESENEEDAKKQKLDE